MNSQIRNDGKCLVCVVLVARWFVSLVAGRGPVFLVLKQLLVG
jgi:hypothetical protein